MAADYTALNAAVEAAAAQAEKTRGTEASAAVIIAAIQVQVTKAVTDALKADDAADQGSVDAATAAIASTVKAFADSDDVLGAAIAANNPTPPPPVA